tara:strand:+ start:2426 stop:3004 length:579 start_codon:yes stop_codon:yes gene_type:complete
MDQIERHICETVVLSEYDIVKSDVSKKDTIICQYIGTFSQGILISIISVIEQHMTEHIIPKTIQKRLSYLIIESIQNIIHHSFKLPDNSQLAYIIISKGDNGYNIHTSNVIRSVETPELLKKVNFLLKTKKELLPTLFKKKLKKQEINAKGHAGLGLLTIINKSDKNYNYKISEVTSNYSLFHAGINLDNKI